MPAILSLCHRVGIESASITRIEYLILENYLFALLHEKLSEVFNPQENKMHEADLTRLLINDILSTDEYNLQGIAMYTNTHKDVVLEIAAGINAPTALFHRRIIDLHISVRRDFYSNMLKKIVSEIALAS